MISRDSLARTSPTRTSVSEGGRDVTSRSTDSTEEFENLSDETEELCSSSFFPDLCDIYLELSAVMPM